MKKINGVTIFGRFGEENLNEVKYRTKVTIVSEFETKEFQSQKNNDQVKCTDYCTELKITRHCVWRPLAMEFLSFLSSCKDIHPKPPSG